MANSGNMICPACGTFQPKAEECTQCGVIIAKAQAQKAAVEEPAAQANDKSKGGSSSLLAGVAIAAALLVGGWYFWPSGESAPRPPVQPKTQIEKVAAYNAQMAAQIQQTDALTKLRTLRTKLYLMDEKGVVPPTNEEGLHALVEKGLLKQDEITDPWGHDFAYRLEEGIQGQGSKHYQVYVYSAGPDGIPGNKDDIGDGEK